MLGQNIFCMIDNGVIYQVSTYDKIAIGYTNDMYNELSKVTEEYYNKLVELGAIIPPKSQEEINAEMQTALKESQNLNLQLMQLLKEMQGGKSNEQANDKQSEGNVSEQSEVGPSNRPSNGNATRSKSKSST